MFLITWLLNYLITWNTTIPLPSLLEVHCSIRHQGACIHHWWALGYELSTFGKIGTSFSKIRGSFRHKHSRSILDVCCPSSCFRNHGNGGKELPAAPSATIRSVKGLLTELLSSIWALVSCNESAQSGGQSWSCWPIESLTGARGSTACRCTLAIFTWFSYRTGQRTGNQQLLQILERFDPNSKIFTFSFTFHSVLFFIQWRVSEIIQVIFKRHPQWLVLWILILTVEVNDS